MGKRSFLAFFIFKHAQSAYFIYFQTSSTNTCPWSPMKTGRQNSPMPQSLGNLIPSKPPAIYTGNIFISACPVSYVTGGMEKLFFEKERKSSKRECLLKMKGGLEWILKKSNPIATSGEVSNLFRGGGEFVFFSCPGGGALAPEVRIF